MENERIAKLKLLEAAVGHEFADLRLLDVALTHRSFINENSQPGLRDNERLEFLGDAVIDLCISDLLMKKYPDYNEGKLSRMRSLLVNEYPLADMGRKFSLGEYLRLGKGEESSGGRNKSSILSNAFEAVVAAIYLDSGFDRVAAVLTRLFEPLLVQNAHDLLFRDFKTQLQEVSQELFKTIPKYSLMDEFGPDHDKTFVVQLGIANRILTSGMGKSKKEAEQEAARRALEELDIIKTAVD
ncbi:MAG: ribonuclease III [Syntrophaceae bacterium]